MATSANYLAAYAEVAGGKDPGNEEDTFTDAEVRAIARRHKLTKAETAQLGEAAQGPMGCPTGEPTGKAEEKDLGNNSPLKFDGYTCEVGFGGYRYSVRREPQHVFSADENDGLEPMVLGTSHAIWLSDDKNSWYIGQVDSIKQAIVMIGGDMVRHAGHMAEMAQYDSAPPELETYQNGHKYRITFRSATQRRNRVLVGTLLGEVDGKLNFSLRPQFGTTPIDKREIVNVEWVKPDTPHHAPKLA